MSGNEGTGKKNVSGRGSAGTATGRRNESGNESGRETETKIATAGPENETETGSRPAAATRPPNAADPGEGKPDYRLFYPHQSWRVNAVCRSH